VRRPWCPLPTFMAETRYHNQIPKAMESKADTGIRMVGTADEKTVCTLCKCDSILMRKVRSGCCVLLLQWQL